MASRQFLTTSIASTRCGHVIASRALACVVVTSAGAQAHMKLKRMMNLLIGSRFGSALFCPGRVVLVAHPGTKSGVPVPGVVLKGEVSAATGVGTGAAGVESSYITTLVLCPAGYVPAAKAGAAVVSVAASVTPPAGFVVRRKRDDDEEMFGGRGGGGGGKKEASVPLGPGWSGVLAGRMCEVVRVSVDAVALVTDVRCKVEATAVLESGRLSALSAAATALAAATDDARARGGFVLVNPAADLKARGRCAAQRAVCVRDAGRARQPTSRLWTCFMRSPPTARAPRSPSATRV